MVSRVYVTKNSEYHVGRKTPGGKEVILLQGRPYAIIGFADPSKLNSRVTGDRRDWYFESTGETIDRKGGRLEEELTQTPREGLRIVALPIDDEGRCSHSATRESVTSKLIEIREN